MCDKCQPHKKHWIHIADDWNPDERLEMFDYLLRKIIEDRKRARAVK